jgi:hypothetical protein
VLLFKCSCGCVFSIKDDLTPDKSCLKCQSCGNVLTFNPDYELRELNKYPAESSMTVHKIPDSAKIEVSFDV